MALDRIIHGKMRPRSETQAIFDSYRAGKLPLEHACAMLWVKGYPVSLAHNLLEATNLEGVTDDDKIALLPDEG